MGKVQSPGCIFCPSERDDAYHTFFVCDRWSEERCQIMDSVSRFTPETIISEMVSSKKKWDVTTLFVETVLRKKKPLLDRAIEEGMNEAADAQRMLQHNLEALAGSLDIGAEGDDEDSS